MNEWKIEKIGLTLAFPQIMGILNATPDSLSGDGTLDRDELVDQGLRMLEQGADILDIGAESTRPFAVSIDEKEERRRVLPVIKGLRKQSDAPLSIDTRHPQTAREALDEGVDMINDITGLSHPDMRHLAAERGVRVIVMHMQGNPENMQTAPRYADVLSEVTDFLRFRVDRAINDGIAPNKLIIDPGIGFGKTLEHNLTLIRNLHRLRVFDCPILLGVSRKAMIGEILNLPVNDRIEGSLAAAAIGVLKGADILRVHDVLETSRFFTVFHRIIGRPRP